MRAQVERNVEHFVDISTIQVKQERKKKGKIETLRGYQYHTGLSGVRLHTYVIHNQVDDVAALRYARILVGLFCRISRSLLTLVHNSRTHAMYKSGG